MKNISNIDNNYIETFDIVISNWLKINGYHLLKSEKIKLKQIFFFNIGYEKGRILKVVI